MIKRLSPILRWTVCGLVLTLGAIQVKAQATTTPASTAPTPAPAATTTSNATPAPTLASLAAQTATLNQQVADLAAYVTNGQAGNELSTATEGNNDSILKSGLNPQPIPAGAKPGTEPAYPNMVPGPGHNAWMLTSTALVLMMTLPGLALFYGGLVRRKNVLSVCAQCFAITGLVTILWWLCGYGLVFGVNHGYCDKTGATTASPLGDLSYACFGHTMFNFPNDSCQPQYVDSIPNGNYGYWMSNNVYACFQLTFAIITPALIVGGIAERMKFSALVIFIGCWMFIVYFPLAHNVWGVDGMFNGVWNSHAKILGMDFAGGTVVHMSSGWSGLTLALIVGKRLGWGKTHFSPHSTVLTFIGASLLWVGWYGFNAGSACAADIIAANAFTTTTLATATASFVWPTVEYFLKGKATVVGFCSGAVAGLVVITPACGYVNPLGGMIIGVIAGTIPYLTTTYLKPLLGYDDALDVFGVHAVGGMCGAIATGFLADPLINPNLSGGAGGATMNNLCLWYDPSGKWLGHLLYVQQFYIVVFTILISVIGTAIIGFALKYTIGLRPTPEQEEAGLDISDHGEEGYIL